MVFDLIIEYIGIDESIKSIFMMSVYFLGFNALSLIVHYKQVKSYKALLGNFFALVFYVFYFRYVFANAAESWFLYIAVLIVFSLVPRKRLFDYFCVKIKNWFLIIASFLIESGLLVICHLFVVYVLIDSFFYILESSSGLFSWFSS